MGKVKMNAVDMIHLTSVRAEPLLADGAFEVDEAEAKQLDDRGLAKRAAAPKAKAAK